MPSINAAVHRQVHILVLGQFRALCNPHVGGELLASSLARYRDAGLWARTPEVSRQGFRRLADSLKSGGFISRLHAYENCVDQSFAS